MTWDEKPGILDDPEPLVEAYIPTRIVGRESQISDLTFALMPAAQHRKPIHCWLHGDPGTGKTASVRWLLRKLQAEAGLRSVYINCWEYPTYFAVLDRIVRELRVLGAERLTVSFKLERLQRHIGHDPLIVVLDEIDQPPPKERHSILYNLSQLSNIGLVCLCNAESIYFDLEQRVKSRLNAARIVFRAYPPNDLVEIVRQRAQDSLVINTWSERTVQKIAGLAEGDARIAIQILRNAALLAETHGAEAIDVIRVHRAWHSANDVKKTHLLRRLTDHHRLLCELIVDKPGILSGDLWRLYLKTCRSKRIKPIAVRTYSDYCNKLADSGLVEAKRAAVAGKVREFKALM